MSTQAHDRLAPFQAAKAEAEAKTDKLMMSIDKATKAVQSMMTQLHGGTWRVHIDHQSGFVLVAPTAGSSRERIAKPKRGEPA